MTIHSKRIYPFIIIACLLITGCSKVMFTNRSRSLLVSETQLADMGKTEFKKILKTEKISSHNAEDDQLKRVAQQLTKTVNLTLDELDMNNSKKNFEWEFALIDNKKTVNAFCLPGGKIVVYTGLMQLIKSDDELAVVLGHEIAHAIAQHGNERLSQQLMTNMGANILGHFIGLDANNQSVFNMVYGLSTNLGILLPYSRLHEKEADQIGMLLLAKAGYNPQAAISFWERFSQFNSGAKTPEFFSTHPAEETRINDMKAFLPEALNYYHASKKT